MTEAYAAWLGDWTLTGANGLTQNVTFSKGKANKTFKMTGYEGLQDLPVVVDWYEEEQCWQIYNQSLGTYNFGASGNGEVWFIGEDAAENLFLSELPICVGGMFEDGTLGCLPFEGDLEMQNGDVYPYAVNDMLYVVYFGGSSLGVLTETYKTGFPTFPITITPVTKAGELSVKEFQGGKKTLDNPFAPKVTFKVYNYNMPYTIR